MLFFKKSIAVLLKGVERFFIGESFARVDGHVFPDDGKQFLRLLRPVRSIAEYGGNADDLRLFQRGGESERKRVVNIVPDICIDNNFFHIGVSFVNKFCKE